MKVNEIASLVGGTIIGDSGIEITGTAKIESAKAGELSFISNQKYEKYLTSTESSAVILSKNFKYAELTPLPAALILVDEPYYSFIMAMDTLNPKFNSLVSGKDKRATIHSSAKIGENCAFGANVFVGENVSIGDDVVIQPNSVIENDVTIGSKVIIFSNVTIRSRCIIGSNVTLHPGVVIGADGFGFLPNADGSYKKIPQLGNVVIEDDVEIGANTCIDRATLGETLIKKGTKLDNLIQVGHNVVIGEHTVIAGQTGIAGSTKIGNYCKIGGHVGIAGHLFIGNNISIGAQSLVTHDLRKEGETFWGFPAKEADKMKRIEASLRNLPDALKTIYELEKTVSTLKDRMKTSSREKKERQPSTNYSTYSGGHTNYNR